MDWTPILDYLNALPNAPWVHYVLMGLGVIVVIGTVVDSLIPDEKDGGFMTKILAIPVLGQLLSALTKFSPLNTRSQDPK